MSPVHARFVERIMQSSAHVLFTVRAKTEWDVTKGADGKATPERVGLAPVQRDGLEYEPDLFFDMTPDHRLIITKGRTIDWPALETGSVFQRPGDEFADLVIGWIQDGEPPVDELAIQVDQAVVASVDRETYEAARDRLKRWMRARGISEQRGVDALDKHKAMVMAAHKNGAAA
jgi:hypothetical protein